MERLPEWERGTPGVLCVAGPHPIPVTAFLRAGDDRVLLAIGRRRETLRRLREEPSVALLVMGKGLAFTAHGRARVIAEELDATDTVVAVELSVDRVQDHLADGRTEMLDGARWYWCDEQDGKAEDAIVAELARL
jgi:Pyridoxamine 5'-phosphate oxidase